MLDLMAYQIQKFIKRSMISCTFGCTH